MLEKVRAIQIIHKRVVSPESFRVGSEIQLESGPLAECTVLVCAASIQCSPTLGGWELTRLIVGAGGDVVGQQQVARVPFGPQHHSLRAPLTLSIQSSVSQQRQRNVNSIKQMSVLNLGRNTKETSNFNLHLCSLVRHGVFLSADGKKRAEKSSVLCPGPVLLMPGLSRKFC